MVVFDDVSFAYGEQPVLRDLSLRIDRGQVVAIMGGSGSGKTTLLKLIGGQLRAGSGRVLVDGDDVTVMNEAQLYGMRRKLGMLFQFGALFTDLSVYDNVAFPLRERGRLPESVVRDLVLMKLQAVGLRGAAQLMPAELSGGMARRVALARAIALDPAIMLYDEPFTGLDPISLGVTGQLIRELNDALGGASIVVTHDVAESLAIVDYVYFLADGAMVAQGTPDEVRNSTHPFVRQFINGEPDGPVPFHREAEPYAAALNLERP
ncbi:ABC transporter ATP-binding protein [Jeongeupia chitinilytica]|uniref:ABC transporter ATP-binding protein n=1 Tax=Jeongeupia chitinilytica TaxID=1041641 RepID=A0ABQ3H0S8_9NEIS|nr:ABC transporter ATP-binding protein [Jeongeupia chitinilytica]GHD61753.1 ABC transporter ATP-binding protein [Jeongeupia chitinilytica]